MLIRQTSEHGRKHQLHHRVGREKQSNLSRGRAELRAFRVIGKYGNDDPEAHQIDEDRDEDDEQG